ncbi:putative acyl-CoA dehydrogenase 6 [Collichthys lucidus]|uniref:Guanine nucleotide-binding protein subunit gamma n=1 Tax=Collichthys lucidus TaxID=240159 RepID=A0A4U5VL20_COLLU|nr:putative acyl-CoA dehydrogenase 6 [Collichthys lucidus]
MPVINVEDLTDKDKAVMEVNQLKIEVKLERWLTSKCCEEIKEYIQAGVEEDILVKGIAEDKNPFKEKGVRWLSENVSSKPVTSSASETTGDHLIYTAEHFALKESLRKIIDQEINPYVDQWEAERTFPAHKIFKILGSAGFLGVNKPVEYGGLGLDFSYSVAVAEELGNIRCGGVPMAIGVQSDMATPALARFGSAELKKEFLLPSIMGDKVACLGVSEVGAGSDVSSIKTKAVRQGDEYVINGGKMWTTNGTQADWMCLLANTSDGPPHRNKSLFCLPMNLPGVQIARKIDKLGMWSSDTAEVFFDDVRIPCNNIIGQEGMGFTYQMLQFQEERLWAVANVLTVMDNIIQETIQYTRQRKIFKQPVLYHQTVHFRLAELQTEVELLRSLLHRATALYIKGNDVTKLASMAKLKGGRLVRELSDSCLQFWGGMGFTSDVLVTRVYRDTRLMSIGGGADEVMLGIISKYMDTLPRK